MQHQHTSKRLVLTPPLSSKHASYLQDWADKHNCVKFSPIPLTRHGKTAYVSLSGKSAIIHCNASTGAYDGMYHSTVSQSLPSPMLSSLARLLWEHSRVLRLSSKASSDSAFLKGWPCRAWRGDTKPARETKHLCTFENGARRAPTTHR